ncbi:regulatory LuxR family protein [Actinomycetospora succinea]|uniref:Regulatory LuxR family protein n=1 Tax=Actinomycetospora succinea TaxID=663603 RepID=A0A4R6UPT9_9PSEU|nr:LuxR C-terminal-related transcriptional regulator [Actinomycetospora succinea]TDQ49021.1 regulatory LuxR family protein [Actinomycetospora succinea]
MSDTTEAVTSTALGLLRAAGAAGAGERRVGDAVLDVLHTDPAVCASAWDVVEPLDGRVRTVCARGYRSTISAFLRSPAFLVDDDGYRLLREQPDHPARSWSDVDGYETGPSVTRVFRPGGYTGGATVRLTTPGGRYVGNVHLSTAGGCSPGPGLVAALNLAAGTLATLLDPTRRLEAVADGLVDGTRPGDARAALLGPGGDVAPLPGRAAPPRLVLTAAAVARPGTYRVVLEARWHLVRLVPVSAGVLVLVTEEDLPAGVSARELDVLTHVAQGLTNRATARRLGIAERTVAHHLERVTAKLGATSRAAVAAVAVAEGLRRLPPG